MGLSAPAGKGETRQGGRVRPNASACRADHRRFKSGPWLVTSITQSHYIRGGASGNRKAVRDGNRRDVPVSTIKILSCWPIAVPSVPPSDDSTAWFLSGPIARMGIVFSDRSGMVGKSALSTGGCRILEEISQKMISCRRSFTAKLSEAATLDTKGIRPDHTPISRCWWMMYGMKEHRYGSVAW